MIRRSVPTFVRFIPQSQLEITDESLHDSKLRLHALQESNAQVKKLAQALEKTSLRVKKNKSKSRSPAAKAIQGTKAEPAPSTEMSANAPA